MLNGPPSSRSYFLGFSTANVGEYYSECRQNWTVCWRQHCEWRAVRLQVMLVHLGGMAAKWVHWWWQTKGSIVGKNRSISACKSIRLTPPSKIMLMHVSTFGIDLQNCTMTSVWAAMAIGPQKNHFKPPIYPHVYVGHISSTIKHFLVFRHWPCFNVASHDCVWVWKKTNSCAL